MLAVPNPPVRSGTAFLDAVERSGLLKSKQLDRAAVGATALAAEDLAKRLVAQGLLTSFQAKRLLAGKTEGFFLGPYEMLEPLGPKVYRARHRTMNRIVAVKLLTPDRSRPDELRAAFQVATRSAVQLLHPNIVTTFDANQCGERMYAVLEYVPSRSLAAVGQAGSPVPVEFACECARQIALALQHAHDRGTVHGLLNPDNVLVGDAATPGGTPVVKVLNFGFGRLVAHCANGATSQLDGAIALADYLAPETFDPANAPTPAGDLFSLGCLLHYLLAGRAPTGDRPIHQFSHRYGVERWRPGLSSELIQLVRELLSQQPIDRPASAASVAERLAALEHNHGTGELSLPAISADDPDAASPFDQLERASEAAPRLPRRRRAGARAWSDYGGYLLAAFVILATGSAVALALRSAVR